jgi:hypothetical protein
MKDEEEEIIKVNSSKSRAVRMAARSGSLFESPVTSEKEVKNEDEPSQKAIITEEPSLKTRSAAKESSKKVSFNEKKLNNSEQKSNKKLKVIDQEE